MGRNFNSICPDCTRNNARLCSSDERCSAVHGTGRADVELIIGEEKMRIAVTYENGTIFQHFGHTEQFKIYEVSEGRITEGRVVDTNGSGHGALAGLLAEMKVDTLICGGIGGGAIAALENAGIKLYGGVSGEADEAVKALLEGRLDYNPDAHCDHHGHEHHGGNCGEDKHGCAGNSGHCG